MSSREIKRFKVRIVILIFISISNKTLIYSSNQRVDALIAVGKNSASYGETKKFYHTLQLYNKLSPEKLVNTPFVEIDNVANLLSECPGK